MNATNFEMIAKTLYGLEDVLAEELTALGAKNVEIGRRMVSFYGDKELLYRTNLYCRTALRILKPICHFKAKNADTVYKEVKKVSWEDYLSLDKTFAIDSVVNSDDFTHSKFVAYRTKDAIVDYFMEKENKRPSVRINNPDLYINIHISHNDCTLSIDSSGESLHKRGYRIEQTDAPLNEVLAAGMILKTGWKGESNFVDPMCGSGTLLIEAAMIALNIAPCIHRKEFAFEKWVDFDQELFESVYNDDSREREFSFKCYGSDISPNAIDIAAKNARNAGLSKYIDLKVIPFQQYAEAPQPGILVMNPPYGERISSHDILTLYKMIGERLKHAFTGYKAWILSYKDECFEKIGLRPSEKIKLMNGSLECEYRCYELFEGKNKDYKKSLNEQEERVSRERSERKDFNRGDRSERKNFDRRDRDKDRAERKSFDRKEPDRRKEFGKFSKEESGDKQKERKRISQQAGFKRGKTDSPARRFAAAHKHEDDNDIKTFLPGYVSIEEDNFGFTDKKKNFSDYSGKKFGRDDDFGRDKKSFKKPDKKRGRDERRH